MPLNVHQAKYLPPAVEAAIPSIVEDAQELCFGIIVDRLARLGYEVSGDVTPHESIELDSAFRAMVRMMAVNNGELAAYDENQQGRSLPKVGDRVRLVRAVERYPFFVAGEGEIGTVVKSDEDVFSVHLDNFLLGAEQWGNEVQWYTIAGDDPIPDVEILSFVEETLSHYEIVRRKLSEYENYLDTALSQEASPLDFHTWLDRQERGVH